MTDKRASILDEFTKKIPKHIDDMPSITCNGVTRNEMEYKHICFAMADQIIQARQENEALSNICNKQEKEIDRFRTRYIQTAEMYTRDTDDLAIALTNLYNSISGGPKACGHDYECTCAGDEARRLIELFED